MLVEDWREEQRIEDIRAALTPWVTARVNGNKGAELENFLVLGGKAAEEPREQSQEEMVAIFRRLAREHNARLKREGKL